MTKTAKLMLLTGLALLAAGAMPTDFTMKARADVPVVTIRLDNRSTGDPIHSATGTNSVVTVRGRFCGTWYTIGSRPIPEVSNSIDFSFTDGFEMNVWSLERLQVSIGGDDMFWLDQIELLYFADGFTDELWQSGVDDRLGRCLSTDPSDGSPFACDPDGSTTSVSWTVPGSGC